MKKEKLILNISTKNRGMPGKSFIHVISLDYYLKIAMSCLSNTNFLNLHVMSQLKWKTRYKDRERTAKDFMDFMTVYDESRINCLFPPCKFFSRSKCVILINKVRESIEKYDRIVNTPTEDLTKKDLKYIFKFKNKWGNSLLSIYSNIPYINKKINQLQEYFLSFYTAYILQGLMKRRKGVKNTKLLHTDMYNTYMSMLDSYNTLRSKVPFNSYLKFFIRSEKHSIIQEEEKYTKEGIILTNDIEESLKNNTPKFVPKTLKRTSSGVYKRKVEKLGKYLPPSIFGILVVKFGILEPLKPSEEVALLLQ